MNEFKYNTPILKDYHGTNLVFYAPANWETSRFYPDFNACQGAVLTGGDIYSKYILVVPTTIFNKDIASLLSQWVEFIKIFNPNLKLHLPNPDKSVRQALNLPNPLCGPNLRRLLAVDYETEHNALLAAAEKYIGEKGLYTVGQFIDSPQKFFLLEFPNDELRRLTITLTRYLTRSYYQHIPQAVLDLYQNGVPAVAALYLGHYAMRMLEWSTIDELNELLIALNERKLSNQEFWNIYPKNTGYGTKEDWNARPTYDSYYGMMLPNIFKYNKLINYPVDKFVKNSSKSKTVTSVICDQQPLLETLSGLDEKSGNGHNRICYEHFFGVHFVTRVMSHSGMKGIKEFVEKVALPCYQLTKSINTKTTAEFLSDAESISKQIYG